MFLPLPAPRLPARLAVPRRSLHYDVRADELLLHSMLSPAAYAVLATDGVLRCDPSLIDEDFRTAYDWLCQQARQRVRGARGVYPIWFWAQIRRDDLLLNVRHAARYDRGSVLITCRIQRSRCLLSAYDDWHCALNLMPLVPVPPGVDPDSDAAFEDWEREHDAVHERLDGRLRDAGLQRTAPFREWPSELRREVAHSWEHLFDIDAYPRNECWQATVEEVHASDVTTAVRPLVLPWKRLR